MVHVGGWVCGWRGSKSCAAPSFVGSQTFSVGQQIFGVASKFSVIPNFDMGLKFDISLEFVRDSNFGASSKFDVGLNCTWVRMCLHELALLETFFVSENIF